GDPINYAPFFLHDPATGATRDVFVTEGLLDPFTPADTTEALAAAARLPLVGPIVRPVEALSLRGLAPLDPPVTADVALPDGPVTAALSQYPDIGHYA